MCTLSTLKYLSSLTPATEVRDILGEDCWGGATFGLWVSERGREAAMTEATCLLMLEASDNWLEFDRGRESLSASTLLPLLCDRRLDGVGGRAPPPVNDLGPEMICMVITEGFKSLKQYICYKEGPASRVHFRCASGTFPL